MKNSKKKAIIVAMAMMTGATIAQEEAAAQAAMQDMKQEGINTYPLEYTWNPYDGLLA